MVETRNGSPVVERTAHILGAVAEADGGATLADLVDQLDAPRSTVYRILNSLAAHGLVQRLDNSARYGLGPRFVELARRMSPTADRATLVDLGRPILTAAAERVGETFKLSAAEGREMMTLLGAPSPGEYSLTVRVGARSPLHVGAAGKLALAHAGADAITAYCAQPLEARTTHTITDPEALRENLDRALREGYAEDMLESGHGIRAIAAPVIGRQGFLAAVSCPFIGDPTPERLRHIRNAVIAAARELTEAVGG
jgi:IclR family acetate operon transcriptional repressor